MSETDAALMNLLATGVVVAFSVAALYRLDTRYHVLGRFVFRSYVCWVLAWLSWAVLWGIVSFVAESDLRNRVVLILSDINTVFIFLFYFGLTRGPDIKPTGYVILSLTFAATFLTVDLFLMTFPGSIGTILQDRWSLALAMAAPVLIGWACSLRYDSSFVLIIAIIYAVGQPAAQEAVIGTQMTQNMAAVVLTLLALLKVLFGAAVTYAVGYEPATYDSLVRTSNRSKSAHHDPWWPVLPLGLVVTGLAIVLAFAASKNSALFNRVGATAVGAVTVLAALLKIFEFLADRVNKRSRGDDDNSSVSVAR